VIAGGSDRLVRDFDFFQFCNLYAMSTREVAPEEACGPLDMRRDGFVLSEGAAFLVLERFVRVFLRDVERESSVRR
jgi:3-oxoacyl-[acyl-carrier-protein] synthase II